MVRLLSFFIVFVFITLLPSYAQEEQKAQSVNVPTGDFTALKHTKSGRIDKVIDGLTILLKDGTIIRLASLDIPDFAIWRNAPYSEAALELLQNTLPEGSKVMVYQTRMAKKGRITRMKHALAHIVTEKDKIWLQGLLLANGLARVYTAPDATEMLDQMLEVEQTARAAKRRIWADDSDYQILTPETAAQAIGDFTIVQGTVKKTATVRNNVYLNFGQDWKKDFTITITPNQRKKLARKGINPLSLSNQTVRVRGWLREYNGPMIELEDVSHLEYPINPPPALPSKEESPNLGINP